MTKRVLITGKSGLVGNALQYQSKNFDYDFIFVGHKEFDLTKEDEVVELYQTYEPHYVIHTAALVGGIVLNMTRPAELYYQNILMNSFMIHYAWKYKVEKLFVFSSVCAYPNDLVELKEDALHDGLVFHGNLGYGYSKRMVDVQIRAYRQQYNLKNYLSIIPGNLVGPNDNYNLINTHVVPALIHRLYLAKQNNEPFCILGDGKSIRQFILSDDCAQIILRLLEHKDLPDKILVSTEPVYTIRDIVDKLVKIAGFTGEVRFAQDGIDGQRVRVINISRLKSLLQPLEFTDIDTMLRVSWEFFVNNYPNIRI